MSLILDIHMARIKHGTARKKHMLLLTQMWIVGTIAGAWFAWSALLAPPPADRGTLAVWLVIDFVIAWEVLGSVHQLRKARREHHDCRDELNDLLEGK